MVASSIRARLGELCEFFDGPHATPTRLEVGPYFLNIAALKSGRLDLAECDHVSDDDYVRWTRRVTPCAGDLLFSYETRLGEAALMPDGVRACLGRRMALMRPDPSLVNSRFLLYFYLSPEFQRLITERTVHGATVPRIGLASMPEWEVEIPAPSTQVGIAEVLAALDDKIAANEMLVDSSNSLMRAVVAAIDEQVPIEELAIHTTVSASPDEFDESVAHFSLPAFDSNSNPEIVRAETIKSTKFVLTEPSVLFSKLNPRIPRIWNVAILPSELCVASTEFVVLVPRGLRGTSALWAAVSQPDVSATLAQNVAGTSGSHQRIKPAELLKMPVRDIRRIGADVRESLESLGRVSDDVRRQSRLLARTRDKLLPLLMSGRLRVRDAEDVVSEMV